MAARCPRAVHLECPAASIGSDTTSIPMLLARKSGFERLDVAQNIACSPLQDECLRGQPIKRVDTIGEVTRGRLLRSQLNSAAARITASA